MTKDEWLKIVKVMNDLYEQNGKFMFETPEKINTWYSCLNDLDYRICGEAIKRFALTNKFRPSIADIREQYTLIANPEPMISEMEAWAMVRKAIGDSLYHAEERFNEFPEIVKRIVVNPDRLTEWASLPSDTVSAVVRAEFRRGYEYATKSIAEERQIGSKQLGLAQKLASQLAIGGGVNVPVVMGDEG